jgi:hypothetical protein
MTPPNPARRVVPRWVTLACIPIFLLAIALSLAAAALSVNAVLAVAGLFNPARELTLVAIGQALLGLVVALVALALPVALIAVLSRLTSVERWHRAHLRAGRCPGCRYEIRSLPQRRCPECGIAWD